MDKLSAFQLSLRLSKRVFLFSTVTTNSTKIGIGPLPSSSSSFLA